MSIITPPVTTTGTESAAATVIAIATDTKKTMIRQSYKDRQVPALGSKGAAIRSFLFKQMATTSRVTVMTTMTQTAAAAATATATAKTKISQAHRAWQVPALGSKGAGI